MAEKVEIEIPGIGKIEATNAATEATLLDILEVLKNTQKDNTKNSKEALKNSKGGKSAAADTKGVDQLNKSATAASKAAEQKAKADKAAADSAAAMGRAGDAVGAQFGSLANQAKFAGTATLGLAKSMLGTMAASAQMIQSMANVGNSVSGAARALGEIPVVGKYIGPVFGAVAQAAEGVLKAYQDSASVGATFNGSVSEMSRAASGAGMTLDQFSGLIKANADNLMLLGGTTEEGAKRFATLSKEMTQSGATTELNKLGYSTQQVNDGTLKYIGMMGRSGALQTMTTKDIARESQAYMKDLDALAKVTGVSREEKQKEVDALQKNAKIQAALAGIEDPEQQRKMQAYILSFPKEAQGAIAEMIATGNTTSEEAVKLQAMLPGVAADTMQFSRTLQAGGKINDDQVNAAKNRGIEEAKASKKANQALGQYANDFGDAYLATTAIAAQGTDGLKKAQDEQAKTLKDGKLAAGMEATQRSLAAFSNEFQLFLAQSGLLDTMLVAFKALAGFVQSVVMPVFSILGDAFKVLVPIISGALIPAFQILGAWLVDGVMPIFRKLGDFITGQLLPVFGLTGDGLEAIHTVLEDYVEPALYAFSDFIEDNLEPLLIAAGAALIAYNAAKIIATTVTVAQNIAEAARTALTWLSATALTAQTAAAGASAVGLGAMAAAAWAAVAPFLAVAAPVIAAVAAFAAAYIAVKKFGVDLQVMSDAVSYVGSILKTGFMYVMKTIFTLINKIPGFRGDFDNTIKEYEDGLTAEAEKRDKLATGMSQRMEENVKKREEEEKKTAAEREKRDENRGKRRHEREMQAIGDKEKREKDAEEAKKESADSVAVNMADPINMLKSYAKQQNSGLVEKDKEKKEGGKATSTGTPAGAPSMSGNKIEGLGRVAAQFESGGKAGTVSSGHGDFGGKSYGAFQLSSKTGDVDKFLKSSGYADKFAGMKVGSEEFDKKWKEMGEDKDFAKAQQQHAVKTHYDPQMAKLQKSGMDLSGKGAGVQEAIMSTANQYGANSDVILKALKGKDTDKMSDKDIINAIQDYKAENVKTQFKSSSAAVQAGVAKRIEQERAALLGVEGPAGKPSTTADGKPAGDKTKTSETGRTSDGKTTVAEAPTSPTGAFSDLIKNGINPTTFAFQDLIKKGLNPLTGNTVIKGASKEDAEKARAEAAAKDPRRVDGGAAIPAEDLKKTQEVMAKVSKKELATETALVKKKQVIDKKFNEEFINGLDMSTQAFTSNTKSLFGDFGEDLSNIQDEGIAKTSVASISDSEARKAELEAVMNDGQTRTSKEWDQIFDEYDQVVAKIKDTNESSVGDYEGLLAEVKNQKVDIAAAETAKTELVAQAEKEAADKAKAAEEAAQKEKDRASALAQTGGGDVQEAPLDPMSALNTQLAELIKISKQTADLNERQLSVQQGLSGDLFA